MKNRKPLPPNRVARLGCSDVEDQVRQALANVRLEGRVYSEFLFKQQQEDEINHGSVIPSDSC